MQNGPLKEEDLLGRQTPVTAETKRAALLTTLYGAILSNMVFFPIADKLSLRRDQETLNRRLIMDGVLAIQDGQNPRVIDGYLKNYLNEGKRALEMDE